MTKMTKLSDWKWCIDYSRAVGQKKISTVTSTGTILVRYIGTNIAPIFFTSRNNAQKHNKVSFPKGRVIQISIREKK